MGIFDYYLVNKLKSIKQAIKNALVDKGVEVDDNDTFESYADKIKDIQGEELKIINAINPNIKQKLPDNIISDEIGEISDRNKVYFNCFIFPEYTNNTNYRVRQRLFVNMYNAYSGTNIETRIDYVDFSKIKVPEDRFVEFPSDVFYGVASNTVILPDKVKLNSYCMGYSRVNNSSLVIGNLDYRFGRGLIFRGNVYSCSSTWLRESAYGNKNITVIIPHDFTGTLYLSKFNMSIEILLKLLNNLADLTDTGKSYTLNLGTSNLEKLTDEEKNIAYNKGWELT